MKPILVPTDFSECSRTAFRFAVEIAKVTKTKIILFHSFHMPLPPPEAVVSPLPLPMLKEENMNDLKKMADDELRKNKNAKGVDVEYEVVPGFVVDEIIESAKKHNAGMIVMGTQGASGIKKYVFGSNTASVISKSGIPVIAVPYEAKFSGFKKIAFAVDLHQIKNNSVFHPLVELASLFNSEIKLFFVKNNIHEPVSIEEAMEKLNLYKALKEVPHTFHVAKDEDVVHAIDTFVKDSRADLLVTVHQKRSYIESLLNKSVTRDLAFHVKVPLLSLFEFAE